MSKVLIDRKLLEKLLKREEAQLKFFEDPELKEKIGIGKRAALALERKFLKNEIKQIKETLE